MSLTLWPKGGIKKSGLNIYPALNTSERDRVDLREELRDLLHGTWHSPQRGHWVIFRRMNQTQRCICWNRVGEGQDQYDIDKRKYDEPDENCKICNGEGYVYRDELHISRTVLVAPGIGLSRQEIISPVGIMNVDNVVYYFEYYVNPTEKDKIIEIDNDIHGKPVRPYIHRRVLNITVTDGLRDKNGRIEYWKCAVKQEVI